MYTVHKIVFFLLVFLGIFLFYITAFASFDTSCSYSVDLGNSGTSASSWGLTNTRIGIGHSVTATTSIKVKSATFRFFKIGTPTDYVYGVIITGNSTTGTIVATSTNWYSGSSISSSATNYTFTFPIGTSTEFASGSSFTLGVVRTEYNASNYYRTTGTPSAGYIQNDWGFGAESGSNGGQISHDFYCPLVEKTCPDGYECYTLEEMATATQAIYDNTSAIYTVGASNMFFWSVFLSFVLAFLMYRFSRNFI